MENLIVGLLILGVLWVAMERSSNKAFGKKGNSATKKAERRTAKAAGRGIRKVGRGILKGLSKAMRHR